MHRNLTVSDYDFDWVLDARNIEPRPWAGSLSREEMLAFCGTLGIQGIELCDWYWADYEPARLRRLAADAGLPIFSYLVVTDLAVAPRERAGVRDYIFSMLDRTAELGSSRLFLLPAAFKESLLLDQQRAWLVEGLREVSERAQSMGLVIIAENFDDIPLRPFMGRGSSCRELCAQVDSPAFRLIFDAGASIFVNEDSLGTLHQMYPYVRHVHLKNFRPVSREERVLRFQQADDGRRYTGTVLDIGTVPIEQIIHELSMLGYDGSMEIEYQGEDDPRAALKHNIGYVQRILAACGKTLPEPSS